MTYLHRALGNKFPIRVKCKLVHYSVLVELDSMNMLQRLCPETVLLALNKNIDAVKKTDSLRDFNVLFHTVYCMHIQHSISHTYNSLISRV